MKKILSLFLVMFFIVGLAIFANPAFAAQPFGDNKPVSVSTELAGDGALVATPCNLKAVAISGVTAGDWVAFYDAVNTSGTYKWDWVVGTATDTKLFTIPGGTRISVELNIDCIDSDVRVTGFYTN
jgi:hypothetical protein